MSLFDLKKKHLDRIKVVCIILNAENSENMPILIKPTNLIPKIIPGDVNLKSIWVSFYYISENLGIFNLISAYFSLSQLNRAFFTN